MVLIGFVYQNPHKNCCMKQPQRGPGRGFDSRLVHQKCCLGWYVGV